MAMNPVRHPWIFASYLHYARWDIELSCGHHIVAPRPDTDGKRYLCPECTGAQDTPH